jgi:hypothetical protein
VGLITKEVEITIASNYKHYENKGYEIPKRQGKEGNIVIDYGAKIIVDVNDLPEYSNYKVEVICDNCGITFKTLWKSYLKHNHDSNYYCNKCAIKIIGMPNRTKNNILKGLSFYDWCISHNRKDVLDRWDYDLNGCKPDKIMPKSGKKYWFKCPKGKHNSELKQISNFTSGHEGCIDCNQCNLVANTHPDLIKYFVNKEDAYKYSSGSRKKVLMKCPDCGYEREFSIVRLANNQDFSCLQCGDGISYPEKFIIHLLKQLNIEFIYQLSSKNFIWCNKSKYDFYIPLYNTIIETHGIQHYKQLKGNWGTLTEIENNDINKEENALLNGINNYIILDCSKSELNWIKNNILASTLPELLSFKEEDIDWLKCHEYALSNIVKKACDLWNGGMKNTKQIANELKISRVVVSYLNQGAKLGWCDYNGKKTYTENLQLIHNSKRKRVICLNNKKIFNSTREAEKYSNISKGNISRCCRGILRTSGLDPITNERLQWRYYEDYLAMQENNQIDTK